MSRRNAFVKLYSNLMDFDKDQLNSQMHLIDEKFESISFRYRRFILNNEYNDSCLLSFGLPQKRSNDEDLVLYVAIDDLSDTDFNNHKQEITKWVKDCVENFIKDINYAYIEVSNIETNYPIVIKPNNDAMITINLGQLSNIKESSFSTKLDIKCITRTIDISGYDPDTLEELYN